METQWRKPMPSVPARSKIDTIKAPLWLTSPMGPSRRWSVSSTTEEQRASRWWGTMSPMQLGPPNRVAALPTVLHRGGRASAPLSPRLGEAGGEDHAPADAGGGGLAHA